MPEQISDQAVERPVRIVTGLSGAGKSTALRAFEDMRYFTVDGLPASMATEMAIMSRKSQMDHFKGTAIGMDLRQENFINEFNAAISSMHKAGIRPEIVFLEAEYHDLVRRYAATRRPHPLERKGLALQAAIEREAEYLEPIKDMASLVIDSTGYSIHDLRREIQKYLKKREGIENGLRVNVISFGFKHDIPHDTDFIFDLRFLPNPYFVENLRQLSGLDKEVSEYIFSFEQAEEYKSHIEDLLAFALREMEEEGRARVTVAFGCTGGRHRSVAMAEEIAQALRQSDFSVMVEHRHINHDQQAQKRSN